MNNITAQFLPDGMGVFSDVILVVGIAAICLGIIAVLLYTAQSLEKYKRFKRLFSKIAGTINYAAYGTLTFVVIATPCYIGYIGLTYAADNPGDVIGIGKWVGLIAGIYIGMTLLGYATKNKIWTRLFEHHRAEKYENQNSKINKEAHT